MTNLTETYFSRKSCGLPVILALLAVVSLLFVSVVQAAPPDEKGGKKGGGGGSDGGPRPELHLKWRVKLDAPYSLVRPAVAADGTVYAVDVRKNLTAVAPDGTVLWVAADAGSKGVDVGSDGTIYTGTEDWIKAFNPDGSLKWTFIQNPRAFVLVDVAVGPDGNIYGVASSGMGVFSLADTPDGPQLRWTNPEPYGRVFIGYTEIAFGPTVDGLDQQLYFYANGHTRAVRLSDGASIFTLGGGNTRPQVSSFDGSWHRGDSAYTPGGDLIWSFEFPLATGFTEPSLAPDGTHYTINSGNVLYAIDPFGVEEYRTELREFVGLPDVDPTESFLILDTQSSQTHPAALNAVSAANGGNLWRMEFPADDTGLDQFIGSGVAYNANGDTAYVMTAIATTNNTYLNAVDTDPSIPSASTVLRSTDINLDVRSKRDEVNFTGTVTVMDENKGLASGATVLATWTLPDGTTEQQAATTSGKGTAKFSLSGPGGLYRIDVTDISKDGYTFDPQHSLSGAARAWF
ncbi:MAG: PQQ-binding-like beta-propeller repeat protein [Pseudomonadota bacterium]